MLFVIYCLDKPNSLKIRLANRDKHLAWMNEYEQLKLAGPFLSDDGKSMIGSMLVIEADDLDAAKAWATNDPYAKAGLFQSVTIHPWKHVLGAATL